MLTRKTVCNSNTTTAQYVRSLNKTYHLRLQVRPKSGLIIIVFLKSFTLFSGMLRYQNVWWMSETRAEKTSGQFLGENPKHFKHFFITEWGRTCTRMKIMCVNELCVLSDTMGSERNL